MDKLNSFQNGNSSLKACPFCGETEEHDVIHVIENYHVDSDCTKYSVLCENCGVETDEFETCEEAITAWNRRTQPENKPLSLGQLEHRNKPVWTPLPDGTGFYCLCQNGLITPPSCNCFKEKDRHNWTFLDHKPEQEEK